MTSQTHPPATRPALLVGLAVALLTLPAPSPAQDLCTDFSGQWGYGRIFEVEVRDELAYYTQGANVIIADVTEPGAPVELGRVNLPSAGQGLAVGDGVVYTGCSPSLCVVDVADPTQPVVLRRVTVPTGVRDLALSGGYLFSLDGAFEVFDVSDPVDPRLVGSASWVGSWELAISGSHAYVVDGVLPRGCGSSTSATRLTRRKWATWRCGWRASRCRAASCTLLVRSLTCASSTWPTRLTRPRWARGTPRVG